ncbi:cytochrome b562 [Salmonella enterica]|nr:cytochrome b562 [Salmonella enterica]EDR5596551.1 cytochrome b562 [Salmonella enterica subsp. diarizonae]EDU6310740.1 cytochrome b562 [Salmonella enterica subsp. diarizonae serovar 53:z10:z]EBK3635131.1 cytochrome b562 [Salmonella enterica]EGW0492804.1 cytochrome b562 [Salmonella enterica]
MRKHIVSLLVLSCLMAGTTPALARLQSDMQTLAKNLAVIEKSSDAAEMKRALQNMRSAALTAREEIPFSLDGKKADSPEIKNYQQGYDVLISQIDRVVELADKGNIAEAKAAAEKQKETRNSWHMKYRS